MRGGDEKPVQNQEIARKRKLRRLRQQLAEKVRELARLRAKLAGDDAGGIIRAENVVWVFGTGRSGSTWLASMMGEFVALWNEPLVEALFGEFYYERAAHKKGRLSILGEPHRNLWLGHIRAMVLEGAEARYEDLRADTLGEMRRVCRELDMPTDEDDLARAVEKHSWENVPEEE